MRGRNSSSQVDSTICVKNYNNKMEDKWVKDTFSKYGTVIYVDIPTPKVGNKVGVAFIGFSSSNEASEAVKLFNQEQNNSRTNIHAELLRSYRHKETTYDDDNDNNYDDEMDGQPAYVKIPRRSKDGSEINPDAIPRPSTPKTPPPSPLPSPPPIEDLQVLMKSKDTTDENESKERSPKRQEYIDDLRGHEHSSTRPREYDRDRDRERSRDRYGNKDRNRERDRDRYKERDYEKSRPSRIDDERKSKDDKERESRHRHEKGKERERNNSPSRYSRQDRKERSSHHSRH